MVCSFMVVLNFGRWRLIANNLISELLPSTPDVMRKYCFFQPKLCFYNPTKTIKVDTEDAIWIYTIRVYVYCMYELLLDHFSKVFRRDFQLNAQNSSKHLFVWVKWTKFNENKNELHFRFTQWMIRFATFHFVQSVGCWAEKSEGKTCF